MELLNQMDGFDQTVNVKVPDASMTGCMHCCIGHHEQRHLHHACLMAVECIAA